MSGEIYDIAVVGGGVNGCGIARDAAGRGLSVLLAEKNDLASGTSSASTKLIHGGLRYLEHYEFRLVREALMEREVLWAMAPHIIWPLRFVLPHHKALRPSWLIRLGLFLYDHLGGRKLLPASNGLDLTHCDAGKPLKSLFRKGFEYSDCWVDDARLVVLNAVDAAKRGADIRVRTEVTDARREGAVWKIELKNSATGKTETIQARTLVNASGPWILDVIGRTKNASSQAGIRLVKGSHVVVPKLFEHDRAYIFQNADQRIIFAIPYAGDFTLVGTTDVDFEGKPDGVEITQDEIDYLCTSASEYFTTEVRPGDVVWSYSGVRPLYDDGVTSAQEATRDYVLDLQAPKNDAALLNIFGGKITTYRRLAEEALEELRVQLSKMGAAWTAGAALPGGDFPVEGFERLLLDLKQENPALDPDLVRRLARAYGTLTRDLLQDVTSSEDLGIHFGANLYQREVEYLVKNEWAKTADDILWRRSKLGLRMRSEEIEHLEQWLAGGQESKTASVG